MKKEKLTIHSENILPIIKKWLYSDKDIFVRELVSNACDAIYKLKILRDQGEVVANDADLRIDIQIDKAARTLTFSDTGIGMDASEVEKYIAQIAFSGAEEFLDKYKSNKENEQVIGHFGLGFYSAYMVADRVDIQTLSYKPDSEPVFWTCDGSTEYEIDKGTRTARGTDVILHLNKENEEYLDEYRLNHILHHYCDFLPYPIYLNGKHINVREPLWLKAPSECTNDDYLEFYRHLYPMDEDPLFWVHLNVDYPFHLKGILYFPKIKREFDMNKNTVKLYCNRVFVSDNCKDVIPNYLMILRGVIDSPDIPLNVSRSYLQMDRTVRQLGTHISKKVADSLSTLYRNERERFLKAWDDVSLIVKLGSIEDDKFYERAKEFLVWKNADGEWTTVEDYLTRNREKTRDRVYYTRDEKLSHFLDVYRQKNVEVLMAPSPIDNYLIQFLEQKLAPVKFQRIDSEIDEQVLDKSREKTVLDAAGKTEATKLADFVRAKLSDEKVEIEAKSLATDTLPGIVLMDEKERRMREYLETVDPQAAAKMGSFDKKTFVVNTNNPLMEAILELDKADPELAKELVRQTYELSLLSQREMHPANLKEFIQRSYAVLGDLAKKIVKK